MFKHIIISLAFFRSFSFFQLLCSTINFFYLTKYFITPLVFLLFNIFSTFYFLTFSTSTSFTSSTFDSSTCSLYYTIWLTFITRWILIKVGSCNLTILVDTTLLIKYGLIYWFTSFFASIFLNTKSFIFNITLFLFFHFSTSFLLLFVYLFISSYTLFNATPTIKNILATEPVMLKVCNVKLSFDIWLVLYMYFILYS